jgi:hypothetical protein
MCFGRSETLRRAAIGILALFQNAQFSMRTYADDSSDAPHASRLDEPAGGFLATLLHEELGEPVDREADEVDDADVYQHLMRWNEQEGSGDQQRAVNQLEWVRHLGYLKNWR